MNASALAPDVTRANYSVKGRLSKGAANSKKNNGLRRFPGWGRFQGKIWSLKAVTGKYRPMLEAEAVSLSMMTLSAPMRNWV